MQNTIADILSHHCLDSDVGIQVNLIDEVNNDFLTRVKELTPSDLDLEPIITALQNRTTTNPTCLSRFYYDDDGLLWYEGTRLVIPQALHLSLLHDHHDAPTSGHPSWTATYDLLARQYFLASHVT